MKQKESSGSKASAEMAAIRRNYTIKMVFAHSAVFLLNAAILMATWGNPISTFMVVLALIVTVREALKSYIFWRWMKDEEKRIQCLEMLVNESKGSGNES